MGSNPGHDSLLFSSSYLTMLTLSHNACWPGYSGFMTVYMGRQKKIQHGKILAALSVVANTEVSAMYRKERELKSLVVWLTRTWVGHEGVHGMTKDSQGTRLG